MSLADVGGTREDLLGTAISSVGNSQGTPFRIPADRYRSEAFAEREHEHVWQKAWIVACSIDHVAAPGDHPLVSVGHSFNDVRLTNLPANSCRHCVSE